jgi:hypothetical protein
MPKKTETEQVAEDVAKLFSKKSYAPDPKPAPKPKKGKR